MLKEYLNAGILKFSTKLLEKKYGGGGLKKGENYGVSF
jgi:hypothetical protein